MRLCDIEGCDRPHSGHGLCKMHLRRLYDHGGTGDEFGWGPGGPSLRQRTEWRPASVTKLVRQGVIHATLPGSGRVKVAGEWLPAEELRALAALRSLTTHAGVSSSGTTHVPRSAQVAVATAARSHAPGALVDVATNEPVADPGQWVRDWRARGAPVALLLRVADPTS